MENLSIKYKGLTRLNQTTTYWYAIYTRPHHEKEVYRHLQLQSINSYLPLYTTIRQWSDRKKKVTIPLLSCYVFVNISNRDYYRVLNLPGVVRYITFEGKAVPIPENQIRLVMQMLEQNLEVDEAQDIIHKGAKVQIVGGPLTGITGELIDYLGKKRVVIRLDSIQKSLIVNVPIHLLKLVG